MHYETKTNDDIMPLILNSDYKIHLVLKFISSILHQGRRNSIRIMCLLPIIHHLIVDKNFKNFVLRGEF